MRSVVLALCFGAGLGCTFHGSGSGPPADARDETDADAGPPCAVEVAATLFDRGRVGGSQGGTPQAPLACPSGQPMVGIALLVSDGVAGGPQERSAQGIRLGCAPVTIAATATTGTISTVEAAGDGGAGWAPSQWTAMTTCPAGQVIGGMAVHSGQYDAAFINASVTCIELDAQAHTIASQDVYVAGSLDELLNPHAARCNAGEILAGVTPRTGAGLDSVDLACATPRCAP